MKRDLNDSSRLYPFACMCERDGQRAWMMGDEGNEGNE